MVGGSLVAAGGAAMAAGWVLHTALWALAPLNLLFLGLNYRQHRNPAGLLVAGVGTLFIFGSLGAHILHVLPHDLIYPGLALLAAGILLDWRSQRAFRLGSRLEQSPA